MPIEPRQQPYLFLHLSHEKVDGRLAWRNALERLKHGEGVILKVGIPVCRVKRRQKENTRPRQHTTAYQQARAAENRRPLEHDERVLRRQLGGAIERVQRVVVLASRMLDHAKVAQQHGATGRRAASARA